MLFLVQLNLALVSFDLKELLTSKDAVLFNNTIFHNLHYGNFNKSAEEVYEAARMAGIHDSIMSWPKQYDTSVGTIQLLFITHWMMHIMYQLTPLQSINEHMVITGDKIIE